jgi:hypothetical protein
MVARRGELTQIEQGRAQGSMALEEAHRIVATLG